MRGRITLIILLLVVFLVRVFDFSHIQFDADFGRDSLFAYRILHDKPTLLGAQASVGGFYLGPLYFYTIAGLFSVFGPVPEIVMLFFALLNVIAAWMGYRLLSKEIGPKAGLGFLLLFAFSLPLITASRGATHMPMLPVITIAVVALLVNALKTGKVRDQFLSGLVLGLFLHVHFSALLLFPGYFIAVLLLSKGNWRERVLMSAVGIGALVLMASPLIVFDLRHELITSKAFFHYLTESAAGGAIRSAFPHWSFIQRVQGLLKFLGGSLIVAAIGMGGILVSAKFKVQSSKLLISVLSCLTISAVGLLLLYHGYLFSYYLIVPGTLLILLVAAGLSRFKLIGLLLAALIALANLTVIQDAYPQTWHTVTNLSRITSVIEQHQSEIGNPPFEVFKDSSDGMTGLAYDYRFLLARDGFAPVSEYSYGSAKILYVVREDGSSDPLTLGNFEVREFNPRAILWQDVVNLGGRQIHIFALSHL